MISIIPAIDIMNGKCVRLTQGAFDSKKVYDGSPVEIAQYYADHGIQRLHLVDLDGAKNRQIINWKTLQEIATQTDLTIDFGGGVQSDEDLQLAFKSGADMVTAGSIAVKDPDKVVNWIKNHSPGRIILGADVREGQLAIHGWQEKTETDLFAFIEKYRAWGIRQLICTEISRDGMLQGPAFELYQTLKIRFPELFIIASGGISCPADVKQLDNLGLDGVIIGKALYEGRIQLQDLEQYLC